MKIIVARLFNHVAIFSVSALITLSGCGVRGPLYYPQIPPTPQAPTQPEPKGQQWPVPEKAASNPTPSASTTK